MANHKSAKKRLRQNSKIRVRNSGAKAAVRTVMKKIKTLVAQGQIDEAKTLLPQAEKTIAQAAAKGLYHKKNASRKVSRMYALVNKAA